MAARKSQDGWEGSPGSSSDSDAVGGVQGNLPCPGAAGEKGMDALKSGHLVILQPLILPVELFPNCILLAGSALLLSGSTSSV